MRSVPLQVCQRLMVSSYCTPGSPHCHAAWQIWRKRSRARTSPMGWSVVRPRKRHRASFSTARMKSSVTRTERLLFWKKTDW